MTESLADLVLATTTFIGAHIGLSSHPLRDRFIGRIGARPFLALYSVVVAIPFAWMIAAYIHAPYIVLWIAPTGVKHVTLSVMLVVSIFIVASLSPNNPTVAGAPTPNLVDGPKGIFRITRHPFMWGVALWALTHLLANGDAASLTLFGGLAILAVGGTLHIDSRRRRQLGAEWDIYARQSSHLPFLAIALGHTKLVWSEIGWRPTILGIALYLVFLIAHEPIVGVAPMSLVSGIFH